MAPRTEPHRAEVIHLSSAHQADDPRIFWRECVGLARAGYAVAFVVPDPRSAEECRATRRHGVDIVPVRRRSGRLARMAGTTAEVVLAGLRRGGVVYHFHDPELIPWGVLLRLLGKRVVYDVHEDLPLDILTKDWIPPILRRLVSHAAAGAEWTAGRLLSGVVAATPTIGRRFPPGRTVLVQNYPPAPAAAGVSGIPYRERQGIAYAGGLTQDRCIVEIVGAMGRLDGFPEARLLLAGSADPPSLLDALAAMPGWARADYRGHQDRPGIERLYGESRLGLALYRPQRNYMESQPLKIFEYMAAGIPVLAADFPAFRDLVERNGCGLCVPPRDETAIAAAIGWLLGHPEEAEEMGRRGRSLVEGSLNWESQERELVRLYERLLGPPQRLGGVLAADPAGTAGPRLGKGTDHAGAR
ncbi:glycosyltransferase family 4 protein [Arenibaculum pallidiluteum]|uniref:glycosyltransferase family 4 protein n=1 Tax=Arenibaculum pallidiluteum TaxID=2812559 RepID=UPI001A9593F2|nr:glycosyltransferase family 4 protein [Arenibaculum pallidiluteum]